MIPSAPTATGIYSPAPGTLADYRGRFGSMLQGTRGIKRPSASMTGPLAIQGNRVASNDTADNRTTKTVPYAIQVTGSNVPMQDYRADGVPIFIRDAAIYPDENFVGPETQKTMFNTSEFHPSGVHVGGPFNTPYKTSYEAYSLQHMNMIFALGEGAQTDASKPYPTARQAMRGFSYAGLGINQQSGMSADWEYDRDEYSREKQINVAKWGIATSVALWTHYPEPGQHCYLILKRHPREELEKKGLLNFNIRPDASTNAPTVNPRNLSTHPFFWTAWHGYGSPPLSELTYRDPNTGKLVLGARIFVGQFEYSVMPGTSKQFEKAVSDARIAADTGITKMTVYPGGVKFDF